MARNVYYNQYFRDLDERIRVGAVSHPDHWRKMADVVIDGKRLGATRTRMRTPYAGQTRYEKKFEETMILAHALSGLLLALCARRPSQVAGCRACGGIREARRGEPNGIRRRYRYVETMLCAGGAPIGRRQRLFV